LEEIAEIKCGV
jgi:hypothetical protein